jgi:hypothetical protein
LAAFYKKNIAASGTNATTIKQGQRAFIGTRNQCSTVACIAEAYRARYEELAQLGYGTTAATVSAPLPASAPLSINVSGQSNPWDQSVNPTMIYSAPNDAFPPVVVSMADLSVVEGGILTLKCTGGSTNAGGTPDSGCDGLTVFDPSNDRYQPACNSYYPSRYVERAQYPVYIMQVLGAFATSSGVVVGKPFVISAKVVSIKVPAGATRLQLGMNDCKNSDNSSRPLIVNVARM